MNTIIKPLPYTNELPDEEINFGEENWEESKMNIPRNFTLKQIKDLFYIHLSRSKFRSRMHDEKILREEIQKQIEKLD